MPLERPGMQIIPNLLRKPARSVAFVCITRVRLRFFVQPLLFLLAIRELFSCSRGVRAQGVRRLLHCDAVWYATRSTGHADHTDSAA